MNYELNWKKILLFSSVFFFLEGVPSAVREMSENLGHIYPQIPFCLWTVTISGKEQPYDSIMEQHL